jgi:hypothetical protein
MTQRGPFLFLTLVCAATACTPTLDWREVRPEGSGLAAMFPCRPAANARRLALAGVAVEMTLYACATGGVTYAVGFADIGQPQLVGPALVEMAAAAARNIDATVAPAVSALQVAGMTPNPQAGQRVIEGRLPDGRRVTEQMALFARGTRIFQATMVGAKLNAEATETFFGALRLAS